VSTVSSPVPTAPRGLLAAAVVACVAVLTAPSAPAAPLAPTRPAAPASTTLPAITLLAPVFRANGFPGYRNTYVRCYEDPEWRVVTEGDADLIGFYEDGAWIHVRAATCRNAGKALRGQFSATNLVALATIVHESIHRQGIDAEAKTECLSSWIAAHVVLERTGSQPQASRAFRILRDFTKDMPDEYQMTGRTCTAVALSFGIGPLGSALSA
jgi:hypothetical protein